MVTRHAFRLKQPKNSLPSDQGLIQSTPMTTITIHKLDHRGQEVLAYPGRVIRRTETELVVQTGWDRPAMELGYVTLEPGDRWREFFFRDRWYNVFEIRTSDLRLKGWYCNITRPASITPTQVAAEDLALDLWVAPDGSSQVLDEDEFAALPLPPQERIAAKQALADLLAMVAQRVPPFDAR